MMPKRLPGSALKSLWALLARRRPTLEFLDATSVVLTDKLIDTSAPGTVVDIQVVRDRHLRRIAEGRR